MGFKLAMVTGCSVLILLTGCLQKKDKDAQQGQSGAAKTKGTSLTEEGTGPMSCSCTALLPAASRPQFPKVLRGGAPQNEYQKTCEYNALPTGANPNASLAVTVTKVPPDANFGRAVEDILGLYTKTIERQDQQDGTQRRFLAVVDGALGKSVVGVLQVDQFFVETIEYLDSAPADLGQSRDYIAALPGRVADACRPVGE